MQREKRTINHPSPPPMRGSTILLSYRKGSRGLLFTPVHPPPHPYEGFYSPVIICREQQRTINHPSPPTYEGFYYTVIICPGEQRTIIHTSLPPTPSMRCSTLLLSYAKGSRGLLITPVHPPPPYEGSYYRVIICPRREGTIILPCSAPTPPRRCSTILLSYAESSRGQLFTTVPPLPMKCSTILLSYAESSRGLLFTTVHPPSL